MGGEKLEILKIGRYQGSEIHRLQLRHGRSQDGGLGFRTEAPVVFGIDSPDAGGAR